LVAAWALGGLLHWWPRFPAAWRRRLSIAISVAGLAFLVAALQAEGLRESATTAVVLLGPASFTATASASASLYYYVLTALCLLLGFAGIVLGEPLARWLEDRWLLSAVAVGCLVTVARFLLEKSAAPAPLIQTVGVTPMAPVAGAYIATCLRGEGTGWGPLLRALVAYAFLVRGFVALVGVVATLRGLGTHYDVSGLTWISPALLGQQYTFVAQSARQIVWLTLLPQLVVLPVYTIVTGLLGGGLARLVLGARPGARAASPDPTPLPAGDRD
jgi:hypothetical protein